ncbi:metal ABC transporter substrate-binding protein [Candidatus Caldatribacterium sp.]|uniref:metal ABC transporter substrate-binding protein n=1 Tax=Candidatus Caldatribacterium sp. TaxID=2282143 RepID=UPI00299876C8|nr:metal ABC transporter substrate-binding protein [Candidatus Caldatribacterium sp.]MDW8081534.1 metal ABC transporter substrate-binding protein [Candidatus Calescibacterium sp.]
MRRVYLCFLLILFAFSGGYSFALTVAASIPPLCNLIAEVGKERVNVLQLIPNGVNPHTYEPTPLDAAKTAQAEAFFLVGLGFDTYLEKVIKAVKGNEAPIFYVSVGLNLLGDEHESHHSGANPHVWLSLRNAQVILATIAQSLATLDPQGKAFYEENARKYAQVLADLDSRFAKAIASLPSCSFVATHNSLSYLARDYGLLEVGVLEKAPGYEPTPQELTELVALMRKRNVRVIVVEPQFSVKAAQVLAEETGSTLVFFDPLGSFPDTPYHVLMEENLTKLVEAWRGSANEPTSH